MRVTIDHKLCQGHGQCSIAAPTIFSEPDENGYAQILGSGQVSLADVEGVGDAVLQCPESAVVLTES